MRCEFPYFEDRPHIPIQLKSKNKKLRFLPLLDTGADFSVFYKADAIRLDLNWTAGKDVELDNADGTTFKAKQFKITVDEKNKMVEVKTHA